MINKRIVFITLNSKSGNDIKNNLLDMGINLQLLYNSNRIDFIYTDKNERDKTQKVFEGLLNSLSH